MAEIDSLTVALEWFGAERPALLAASELANDWSYDEHAWKLAWALGPVLDRGGHWRESIVLQHLGIAAARRTGDRSAEAALHRIIATAYVGVHEFDEAQRHCQEAVRLCRAVGDRVEEALAHLNAGGVYEAQGRFADALPHAEAARALFEAVGDARREGFALSGLAHLHARLGDHEQALACCERALEPHREVGALARAAVLDSRGEALTHLGSYHLAIESHRQAQEVFHALQYPLHEAAALRRIGEAHLGAGAGDVEAARTAWRQALAILDGLTEATPVADELRALLSELG